MCLAILILKDVFGLPVSIFFLCKKVFLPRIEFTSQPGNSTYFFAITISHSVGPIGRILSMMAKRASSSVGKHIPPLPRRVTS